MERPDLPDELDVAVARRWMCVNCGEVVPVSEGDCSCTEPVHDRFPYLQFKIQK